MHSLSGIVRCVPLVPNLSQIRRQALGKRDCREDERRDSADCCFGIVFLVLTEVADRLKVVYQQIGRLGDVPALAWRVLRAGDQAEDIALSA